MTEIQKILYGLGYFDADAYKTAEIQDYVDEAVEFMTESGVPAENLSSKRALAVKKIWANLRDKGDDNLIIRKDGMIVALISQLRRQTPPAAPTESTDEAPPATPPASTDGEES